VASDSVDGFSTSDPFDLVDGHWVIRQGIGVGPDEHLYSLSVRRPAAITWPAEGGYPAIGYQAFGVASVWRGRISQAVAGVVGNVDSDCERVVAGLAPLLTLFENGRYQIRIQAGAYPQLLADSPPIHDRSFEFDVKSSRYLKIPTELGGLGWEGDRTCYISTEHRDRLNDSTIAAWAARIASGERPVAIAASVMWNDPEYGLTESSRFVIDGHHKLLAYERVECQAPVIHIVRLLEHQSEARLAPSKFAELRDMLRPEQHLLLDPYDSAA
jgi:hypothetical protein